MWSLVLAVAVAPPPRAGAELDAPHVQAGAVEDVRRATVLLEVLGPSGFSTGTGFLLTPDGLIATAAHVVEGARAVRAKLVSGEYLPVVSVVAYRHDLDYALIRVVPTGGPLPIVRLGHSDSLGLGQRLLALGSPFGRPIAVSDGLLSARVRQGPVDLLQVSIPVSPGNSGGPVFTESGDVVGIVVSGLRGRGAENVNFALPVRYLQEQLPMAIVATGDPVQSLIRAAAVSVLGSDNNGLRGAVEAPMSLPSVNRDLVVDPARLEGVEVYTRRRVGPRTVETRVVFGLARTTGGERVVQRFSEAIALEGRGVLLGTERTETAVHISTENHFSVDVEFVPALGHKGYRTRTETIGPLYEYNEEGGGRRSGLAPPGVLPAGFVDAALAGFDGEVPPRLELWFLNPRTDRVESAVFEFTGRTTREVPVARDGLACGPRARTTKVRMEVLMGTVTVGASREPVWVLAEGAHVALDPTVTCVRLPPRLATDPAGP